MELTRIQRVLDKYNVILIAAYHKSISDLNNMPKEIVNSLQKVTDEYDKGVFLEYYITVDNQPFLRFFVSTALTNNSDAASWMKGRILAPMPSFRDLLTISKEKIFLTDLHGAPNCVIIPNYDSWSFGENTTGMPGILDENSTYRSPHVEGLTQYSLESPYLSIQPDHFGTYFQSWLASRIAFMLKHENKLDTFSSPEDLSKYASPSQWTDDAKTAFALLQKERRENLWSENKVPGFSNTLYK